MEEISNLELLKRDDIMFQVIDEDDEDLLDELRKRNQRSLGNLLIALLGKDDMH
jgi:hypothetical protein